MKKANNKSNKLVKVTYEYLGDKFVEKPNGLATHVLDNGVLCMVSGVRIGMRVRTKSQKMRLRSTSPSSRNLKLAEIL